MSFPKRAEYLHSCRVHRAGTDLVGRTGKRGPMNHAATGVSTEVRRGAAGSAWPGQERQTASTAPGDPEAR